jgi:hypothetical protein
VSTSVAGLIAKARVAKIRAAKASLEERRSEDPKGRQRSGEGHRHSLCKDITIPNPQPMLHREERSELEERPAAEAPEGGTVGPGFAR